MVARIRGIAVMLLLVLSGSIAAAPYESHMTIGKNVLAPLSFTVFCLSKLNRCAPNEEIMKIVFDPHSQRQLESVNSAVNRSIKSLSDPPGLEKPWQDDATVGDCDEFALKKRSQLLDLKQPSSALLLAEAIVPNGQTHIVLIVVTDRGDFVLDNLSDNIVRWDILPYHWKKRSSPKNPQFWQTIVPQDKPVAWDQN